MFYVEESSGMLTSVANLPMCCCRSSGNVADMNLAHILEDFCTVLEKKFYEHGLNFCNKPVYM
jgi:hypothetical protein